MEHEVVIPLPVELVQRALDDPALLARCVPGLSAEASDAPARAAAAKDAPTEVNGRLKLRVGSSTITYRGVISLIRSGGSGRLTAFVEGQEARGDGEVVATVRLSLDPDGAGNTVLRWQGDLTPGGRLAEFDAATLAVAGRRLLDRFTAALAEELSAPPAGPALTVVPDLEPEEPEPTGQPEPTDESAAAEPEPLPDDLFAEDLSDLIAFSGPDEEITPAHEEGERIDVPYGFPRAVEEPLTADDVLAGPVRRSIVGRSAEEVDHAPPRGRYAPALPARSARARAASRWYGDQHAGAPVAARISGRISTPWVIGGGVALLGGAVIVARALRRR
ncbi:CoxG family protein [Kitasatospora azatica]|uniref:CoxG family protein n=1 Tax=Kitasatospora azatica TaxID=58347 RepID=UPI00069060E8|nr:SRPBCC domain-containing protein [Kitasatospora azatica]